MPKSRPRCVTSLSSIAAAMRDELVDLCEGAFVEEQFDALAGGELALFVLAIAAVFAAALLGCGVAAVQLLESVHASDCSWASVARRGWWSVAGGWWLCALGLDCAVLCNGAEWREMAFLYERSQ